MTIREARDHSSWDSFLLSQAFHPFLQSWTMGEVYQSLGQKPLRLEVRDDSGTLTGVCCGHIVPARRGRHLSIPYGPVLRNMRDFPPLLEELRRAAREQGCSFIRMSPFWRASDEKASQMLQSCHARRSPLHLLAEHLWYLPLSDPDSWAPAPSSSLPRRATKEESLLSSMRSTTRNLIRRAQKEGVEVHASENPQRNLAHFLALHEETRRRHGFTPYTNTFFRSQVEHFAPRGELSLYLARFQGQVIAASIHMHWGKETSYHHGASSEQYRKIPASTLLQWTAITDALKRGDHIYNFWGVAPAPSAPETSHPFAGVTLFKTGFGGTLLELQHCRDFPLRMSYHLTRGFEVLRKWKRGF